MRRGAISNKVSNEPICFYCRKYLGENITSCLLCKKFCCDNCTSNDKKYCISCDNLDISKNGSLISVPQSVDNSSKIIFVKKSKCCFFF